MTPSNKATVFIVDDDDRMRAATQRLLKTVGLWSESFATPQESLRPIATWRKWRHAMNIAVICTTV
jgi:FixJ family two-component response regulator